MKHPKIKFMGFFLSEIVSFGKDEKFHEVSECDNEK